MVVPDTSGNSSFFYTTDESFGRDEYLKKSTLASSQQYGVGGSLLPGAKRSQSIDSSVNSRTNSTEKDTQRRHHPSSFSSAIGMKSQQPPQQPTRTFSADRHSHIPPRPPLPVVAASAALAAVARGTKANEIQEQETKNTLHLHEPLLSSQEDVKVK